MGTENTIAKAIKVPYSELAYKVIKKLIYKKKATILFSPHASYSKDYKWITLNSYRPMAWCGIIYFKDKTSENLYPTGTVKEFIEFIKSLPDEKCLTIVP